MPLPVTLSYSSIKSYTTCAKKHFHVKVAKDCVETSNTDALLYGKDFHKAAEDFVKVSAPLPEKYNYAKQYLEVINALPGEKLCEHEMGLKEDLTPCGFRDSGVWFRGIADLVVINGQIARLLDYKTGASSKYADTGQLELMSLCIFKHFPDVNLVKAGLLFTVANDFKPAEYKREHEHLYWRRWMPIVKQIETSYETAVWNPTKSGLCKKHCPVISCPHNGANANGNFR